MALLNPLMILLLVLAGVSFVSGDSRAGLVMLVMVAIGVVLWFVQESRVDSAAAKLRAMNSVHATVVRDGLPQAAVYRQPRICNDEPMRQAIQGQTKSLWSFLLVD